MGIETAIGLGAAGAIAGGAKGAKGTPAKTTTQSGTSSTTMAPASGTELQLQQQSLQNYLQSQGLMGQQEAGLPAAQQLQDQSQQFAGNVINGSAFQLTPQQQQQIEAVRQSTVNAGSQDINTALNNQLRTLGQGFGQRNLRGQAAAQLQGQAQKTSTDALSRLVLGANNTAAQQAMSLPMQQVQMQSQFAQPGMTFADQLQQQAIANRNTAQNPALLALLNGDRMRQATTTTTGTNTTPGQKGSWMDALAGGIGGFASGAGTGLNLATGYNDLQSMGQANQVSNWASGIRDGSVTPSSTMAGDPNSSMNGWMNS